MASWGGGHSTLFSYIQEIVDGGSICLKNLSANMNATGIVTVSLDVMGTPETVKSIFSGLPSTAAIEQLRQNGSTTSVSIVDYSQALSQIRVPKSAIFKTVNRGTLALYKSKVFPQDIIPASEFPQAEVYIKQASDVYESDGWTVADIFETLSLPVVFPNIFNYHVTQFSVTAGSPVVNVVQSLIPLPSITMKRIGDNIVVSIPSGSVANLPGCGVGRAEKTTVVALDAVGDKGELRFLRGAGGALTPASWEGGSVKTDGDMTYQTNKLGGIFGILHVHMSSDQARLPTDIWSVIDVPKIGSVKSIGGK